MSYTDNEINNIEDILDSLRNKININDVYSDDIHSNITDAIDEIESGESDGIPHLKRALELMDETILLRQTGKREREFTEIFEKSLNEVIKECC